MTILISAMVIFQWVVTQELNTVAVERLRENTASLRQQLAEESKRLYGVLSIFSTTADLSEAIFYFSEGADRDPISEHLQAIFKKFPITLLLASDHNGRVAFRAHAPESYDDSLDETWLTQDGLQGNINTGYFMDQHGLALRAGGPLMAEGEIVGYIEAGKFLDDSFAQGLKRLTQADVTFYFNDKPIASSRTGEHGIVALSILPQTLVEAVETGERSHET